MNVTNKVFMYKLWSKNSTLVDLVQLISSLLLEWQFDKQE